MNKLVIVLTLTSIFIGCGKETSLEAVISANNGIGCSSKRLEDKVEIKCGDTLTYVYDGQQGPQGEPGIPGQSCTAVPAPGGATVTCGNSTAFIANGSPGPAGSIGPKGEPGRDGLNGKDGESALRPGLSCNVHDMSSWDGVTNILTVLTQNAPVGTFVLPNLNVGNSTAGLPSSAGFPGMPADLQNRVGLTGYALDCNGYLNIETSGMYQFNMLMDDGVRLMIDNQVIINSPQLQAPNYKTSASVELQRGQRSINVTYFQGPHTQIALQLRYSGPHTSLQVVPAARLRY